MSRAIANALAQYFASYQTPRAKSTPEIIKEVDTSGYPSNIGVGAVARDLLDALDEKVKREPYEE